MTTHITATIEKSAVRPFRCEQCQFESVATIRSKGLGHATAWLTTESANEEAKAHADDEADKNVDRLLALAACPACGACDETSREQLSNDGAWKRALTSAGAALLLFVVFSLGGRAVPTGLAVVIALVGGAIALATYRPADDWLLQEVADRVEVLSAERLAALNDALDAEAEAQQSDERRIAELERELAELKRQQRNTAAS